MLVMQSHVCKTQDYTSYHMYRHYDEVDDRSDSEPATCAEITSFPLHIYTLYPGSTFRPHP
jgi:hypothetical protein